MTRPAQPADVPVLVALVHELAAYERAGHEVELDEPALHAALFGPAPAVFCDVASHGSRRDAPVVGLAVWFLTYSTWTGRHGIHLEDLYVRPEHRRGGHGRALLAGLARRCVERSYTRLELSVLDWNAPALAFYRALGATGQDEWTVQRFAGAALDELARNVDEDGRSAR